MLKQFIIFFLLVNIMYAKEYFVFHNKRIELKPYQKIASTPKIRYFTDEHGDVIIIKKQLMVRLNSIAAITPIVLDYDLDIVKKYNNKKYLLEVKDISDIFRVVNAIDEKNAVQSAYPIHLNKSQNERAKNLKMNNQNTNDSEGKKNTKAGANPMGGMDRTKQLSEAFK